MFYAAELCLLPRGEDRLIWPFVGVVFWRKVSALTPDCWEDLAQPVWLIFEPSSLVAANYWATCLMGVFYPPSDIYFCLRARTGLDRVGEDGCCTTPVTNYLKLAEGESAYFYLTTVLMPGALELLTTADNLSADWTTD